MGVQIHAWKGKSPRHEGVGLRKISALAIKRRCATTALWIEMLSEIWTQIDQRNILLTGGTESGVLKLQITGSISVQLIEPTILCFATVGHHSTC